MKEFKVCHKCIFFYHKMFSDMGFSMDGCSLLEYHKNFGLWGCLFNTSDFNDNSCTYYVNIKDYARSRLGSDFKEVK